MGKTKIQLRTTYIPLVLLLVLFLLLWRGLSLNPRELPSTLLGRPVPAFKLQTLVVGQFFSPTDLKGHFSVVNVWATWCATCEIEHAILMDLSTQYRNKIFFYGLNYKDDPEKARQWLQQYGNPYTKVGLDQNGNAAIDWGVYGTPETFLVDSEGKILYRHAGPLSLEVWQTAFVPRLTTVTR